MQIETLAAQHPLVDRVVLIALHRDIPFLVLMDSHAAADSAVTTGGGKRMCFPHENAVSARTISSEVSFRKRVARTIRDTIITVKPM